MPIAIPSSVAATQSLTPGRTSPSNNPMAVPLVSTSPATGLWGLPMTAPSAVPSADPAPASIAIPATKPMVVLSVPAVLFPNHATRFPTPASGPNVSPSATASPDLIAQVAMPPGAATAVPAPTLAGYMAPPITISAVPSVPTDLSSMPSLVLNCNHLRSDANP
jgi:hypothetical protein